MSLRPWRLVSASRLCGVRLSFLLVKLVKHHASSSTALMYASRAGSRFLGGSHVLFSLNLVDPEELKFVSVTLHNYSYDYLAIEHNLMRMMRLG